MAFLDGYRRTVFNRQVSWLGLRRSLGPLEMVWNAGASGICTWNMKHGVSLSIITAFEYDKHACLTSPTALPFFLPNQLAPPVTLWPQAFVRPMQLRRDRTWDPRACDPLQRRESRHVLDGSASTAHLLSSQADTGIHESELYRFKTEADRLGIQEVDHRHERQVECCKDKVRPSYNVIDRHGYDLDHQECGEPQ